MNTLVTATQHLSQPCGPLPVKDCRVRREGNENGKKRHFRRSVQVMIPELTCSVNEPPYNCGGACKRPHIAVVQSAKMQRYATSYRPCHPFRQAA